MMMTTKDGRLVISDSYYDKMCEMTTESQLLFKEGFYPTKEEYEKHKAVQNLEHYLPMLIYFSQDPFSKVPSSAELFKQAFNRAPKPGELEEKGFGNLKGRDALPESEHAEYKELVDYANFIIDEFVYIVSDKEYAEIEKRESEDESKLQ